MCMNRHLLTLFAAALFLTAVAGFAAAQDDDSTRNVLKQGLLGAGTGAIASGVSGGNAGTGALVGAGTNIIGNALLDTITQPAEQRKGRVYKKVRKPAVQTQSQTSTSEETVGTEGTRKKIIRKYDENGKVVSEEEIYY